MNHQHHLEKKKIWRSHFSVTMKREEDDDDDDGYLSHTSAPSSAATCVDACMNMYRRGGGEQTANQSDDVLIEPRADANAEQFGKTSVLLLC